MKQFPSLYTLSELRSDEILDTTVKSPYGGWVGGWVPARPEGYPSLRNRFRLAWLVFRGKADVFTWPS